MGSLLSAMVKIYFCFCFCDHFDDGASEVNKVKEMREGKVKEKEK